MKNLKNIFIQSFMNNNAETFLEVGEKSSNIFISVPTKFNVVFDGTCFITVSKENFNKIKNVWNINKNQAEEALQNQWKKNGSDASVILIIK